MGTIGAKRPGLSKGMGVEDLGGLCVVGVEDVVRLGVSCGGELWVWVVRMGSGKGLWESVV